MDSAVEETRVARYVIESVIDRGVTTGLIDNYSELAFEIEAVEDNRANHFALVPDQRVWNPHEDWRFVGPVTSGQTRHWIVQPGANYLAWVGHDRQKADIRQSNIRPQIFGNAADLFVRVGRQDLSQSSEATAQTVVEGDKTVARHHPNAALPLIS